MIKRNSPRGRTITIAFLSALVVTFLVLPFKDTFSHLTSSAAAVAVPSASAAACPGVQPLLLLPFPTGTSHKCTQASFGSCSHNDPSTRHDLDLDTPNPPAPTEDVVASAPGIAYLHNDGTSNFGMHINVKHDDTYFTIYGHLSEFKVQNGQFVERGQLIAKSGCTGNCQGAHVHWGLHTGDPSASGAQSNSVNATNILARDATDDTQFRLFNSDDFIGAFFRNGVLQCGAHDGHTYTSNNPQCKGGYSEEFRTESCSLPVHPEGTAIRTRSDTNGTVYVLRTNDAHMAALHRDGIPTEQTLWTLYQNGGIGLQDVIAVEDGEMSNYLIGGTICQNGCSIQSPLPSNGRSEPPGRLITNGSEVSIVQGDGGRRPFSSQMTFSQMGYLFCNVKPVSDYSLYLPVGRIVDGDPGDIGGAADEFGPNLSITSHSNGQTVTSSVITLSGMASDAGRGESGVASVTVNGVRASGDTASGSNTANWSRGITLSPGANTITVVATDGAPMPNQTSQTITLNWSSSGGGPGVIATGLSNPTDIATDGTDVFWTDYGSSTVKKVSVNGGIVSTLFSGVSTTSGIALDNSYVYFGYGGDVRRIPKAGGSAITLASNNFSVSHLAVDSANVYWTNYGEGTVKRVSNSGGAITTLATGPSGPWGILLAANNVYWTEQNNPGSIKYVSINGGSVNTLANNSNSLGIDSDGTNIYWTENVFINSGKVNKIPLLGGTSTAIASALDRPWDVVVDGANAYWIGGDQNGYVMQVSLNGGSVTTLASGLSSPVAIAADTSSLYWIERNNGGSGAGTLKKVAKGSGGSGSPGGIPLDFTWQYKSNMPVATWGAATATSNNQIYVLGGSGSIFNNYRYTPATNTWEQKANIPGTGVFEGGAAGIGNKIYAIGNWQDTRIRIYDTTTNQWTTGASMSPQVRRGPNVAAVNGKIYVLGSDDFSLNGLNDVRMYDPATDTWTNKSPMPTARGFASVAVVNNLIYVIGGLDESNSPNIKQAVEVYDPASDTWSIKTPAPVPSYIAGFAAMSNRIYILGGGNGSNALNTASEYDPGADSWRALAPFHTARSQHVAGAVNNKIYLIGGPDASVEEGTPTGFAPSLSVAPRSQTIDVGSFGVLTISISAAQSTDTTVTMSSSNSSIASVSNTIISAGSTTTSNLVWGSSAGGPITIHVKLPDSLAGIRDDVTVTVVNRPPAVTTTAAGTVTNTTATLNGVVNPNGLATNSWFEWSTTSDLSTFNSTSLQSIGSGSTDQSVSANISGLTPNSTYYVRAVASNNSGTVRGSILSFATQNNVQVMVQTSPGGRSFTVDGTTYGATQTFTWTSGSSHTIATSSPQSGGTGIQYVWSNWSDGGGMSHTVVPTVDTTFTANFTIQYFLTMNAGTGGGVSPSSGFFNSGQGANIIATPNAGFSFTAWIGSGSGSYTGPNNPVSVTMNGPITETASFAANPRTLIVASSNPASGVSVTVSPNDNGGQGNGVTQFTRVYNTNTNVSLTAPSTAGGNNFQKWQRDGVDFTTSLTANFAMDANHTMTGVYVSTTTRTLTVASVNPSSGVSITVTPNDNNGQGSGATQFTRVYNNNTNVSLTAPATAGSHTFQKWRRDGVDFATSLLANFVMDANHTMTAVYGGNTPFDFDGDARTDQAVWRPSTGVWMIKNSSNGGTSSVGWGVGGDKIVPGDYDGDGKTDVAIWRPSTGAWFIINSSDGSTKTVGWGVNVDVPVPADYDGDGKTDIAVWRPSNGSWFIINSSNSSVSNVTWGISGDVPVAGDFDGDGKSDIAVWRPSTGAWFIIKSSNGATVSQGWGVPSDKVVPGDYDGDGKTDIAIWRPSTGVWFIINSMDGSTRSQGWGVTGDVPVPGDYDGDGRTDIAVWRPASGTWFIVNSSNGSTSTVVWGVSGDMPVPSAFVGP